MSDETPDREEMLHALEGYLEAGRMLDAWKWRDQIDHTRRGGLARKGTRKVASLTDEDLRQKVRLLVERGESHRNACRLVAKKLLEDENVVIPWETVRARTK